MAKLVVPGGPFVTGVKKPAFVQSRVVSCGTMLPIAAAYNFGFTPGVADNIWLLSVDVWISCRDLDIYHDTIFDVTTGFQEPTGWMQVRDWEKLLPIETRAGFRFWNSYQAQRHYHWDMCKLFTGLGRRFGIWAMTGAATGGIVEASFQISEG